MADPKPAAYISTVTTQRAYTLRLCAAQARGSDGTDTRAALWATHELVNRGTAAFGELLLTMRGGLPHQLAEGTSDTPESRRFRRIILSLCWLTVEDCRGSPADFRVAALETVDVLRAVLAGRGLPAGEIDAWAGDCEPSLRARIRDDATWVNRSAAFDAASRRLPGLDRAGAADLVERFFGKLVAYLTQADQESGDGEDSEADFRAKAREWVSQSFGTGKKTDPAQIASRLRALARADFDGCVGRPGSELANAAAAALGLKPPSGPTQTLGAVADAVGWKGRPSKGRLALQKVAKAGAVSADQIAALVLKMEEEAKDKEQGLRPAAWTAGWLREFEARIGARFVSGRNLTGEFATMLDHACRRVSATHSWIKLAEQRRQALAPTTAKRDGLAARAPQAVEWLDDFRRLRSDASGAADSGYRIRRRAIAGWAEVLDAWSRLDRASRDDRIAAVRELQGEIEKFGDIQLFEALAGASALCTWQGPGGRPDATILEDYAAASEASHHQVRFKVPAYRHPHPFRHPVFCEFGNSRWSIRFDCRDGANLRGLTLGLWTGQRVDKTALRWSSKRLARDLALGAAPGRAGVARSDRLGRAAAGARGEVRVLNVFEEKEWNGRLQADRRVLERIARSQERGNGAGAERACRAIRWFLTFSPKLTPAGPFIAYAADHAIKVSRRGRYFPNSETNRNRGSLAKLSLARLPGLRILGVDLGHRHAAACAVWRTLSSAEVAAETGAAPAPEATFVRYADSGAGRKTATVYRRLADDSLAGGEAHPAPWARLERQFHVKLQGEDRPARAASPDELARFCTWDAAFGRMRGARGKPPRPVDELMAAALRTGRYALRRHGDRARIAHNLTAAEVQLSGGRTVKLDRNGRIALLAETLSLWQALFSNQHWQDPWAEQQWLACGLPPGEADESAVKAAGEKLVDQNLTAWSEAWAARWADDDALWSARGGYLRELSVWLAPRGLGQEDRRAARSVGGLSLTRIDNLTRLYRLLKAYKMRPEPRDLGRNIPPPGDESLANFHGRLLAVRDHLREQRVRQLASRIIEAAIGVGRAASPQDGRATKRPHYPNDAPCHAVVIENLEDYRPDELRTRRENRQIMEWAAARLHKLLGEGCELYGLYLRQVPAAYTSRQCSRTGAPGVRCAELRGQDILDSPYWTVEIARARKASACGALTPEARLLIVLADRLAALRSSGERLPRVRVLRAGGPIFLAVPRPDATASAPLRISLLDADVNAAANIGLRALLDPDWPGRWWYVPCKAGVPDQRTSGSDAFSGIARLTAAPLAATDSIHNLWRDASGLPLHTGRWLSYNDYWRSVREQAAELLLRQTGAPGADAATAAATDIPF